MLVTPTQIRLLILFLAGFLYFIFRLCLHGWSIDIYSWSVLYSNRVLFTDHVFPGDPNKLFAALVGLVPTYFDQPILFPLISAAFGSATCLAVYELILLPGRDSAAQDRRIEPLALLPEVKKYNEPTAKQVA